MRPFGPADLMHLGGKCRAVVELLVVEGRNADDVARRLFIDANGVAKHVGRARRRLAAKGVRLADRRYAVGEPRGAFLEVRQADDAVL